MTVCSWSPSCCWNGTTSSILSAAYWLRGLPLLSRIVLPLGLRTIACLRRVLSRTKPASQVHGTDMGLAIGKAVVEAHGGPLGGTTQLGHRSGFYFSLRPAGPGGRPGVGEECNERVYGLGSGSPPAPTVIF